MNKKVTEIKVTETFLKASEEEIEEIKRQLYMTLVSIKKK